MYKYLKLSLNKFMQTSNNFSKDLNHSRKLQVSKLFYTSSPFPSINRSKSVQFVPFIQQRDKLGKLLGASSTRSTLYERDSPLIQSKFINEQIHKDDDTKVQNIEKSVQSFFKKIDLESKELKRSNYGQRKIVIIAEKQIKPSQNYQAQYDAQSAINQFKLKSKRSLISEQQPNQTSSARFAKKMSLDPQKLKQIDLNFNKTQSGLLKNHSMFEQKRKQQPISNSNSPVKKSKLQQAIHKKSQSLIGSLKVKLNPQQPQYKRYKQQQQRSLKVFQDYEEGHQKFKQKMINSKMVAFKIKKQLQID